jgi:hypothetical protein
MLTYSPAGQPQRIAAKVLADFYTELDRPEVKIEYLFVNKRDKDGVPIIPTRKGKAVWGEVKVVSGLSAYLSADHVGDDEEEPRPFFVVLVNQLVWNDRFNDVQREAFIDSLLCRCEYDSEKNKISTREFDVREYTEVMKRRGAWHEDLEKFIKVAEQIPLPGVAVPAGKRRGTARAATASTTPHS